MSPYVMVIIVAFVLSLIICAVLKSGMKNVSVQEEARAYSEDGLQLTYREDRFTHTTTTRTKIETSKK